MNKIKKYRENFPLTMPTIIQSNELILDYFQLTKNAIFLWAQMDSNHRPSDYESDALTN